MITLILCLIIAIIVGIALDDGPGTFIGVLCVGVLVGLFLTCVIIIPDYDETKTQMHYEKVIAVNGYYVDPNGNWITDRNSRGCASMPIPLPVDRVNGDLFIRIEDKVHKKSVWSLMSGREEQSRTLSLVSEDSK